MQAIQISTVANRQELYLASYAKPVPTSTQVLLKVVAAGINRPDLLQRQGVYPPPAGASEILGLEVAGTIIATGSQVTHLHSGQPVCALLTGGGYAEYCVAEANCCLPIPENYNFIQAAALPETFFTVWSNLFDRGNLQTGESVLVHGGGSGIGTTAIQLGKAFGNQVYVTTSSTEKCLRCLDLHADAAINYQEQDFVAEILQLTAGKGVNVILDMIGGDYFPRNLKCLADDGRLIQIAIQHGAKSEINLWSMMVKRQTISGSTLRSREPAFKAAIAQQLLNKVWPLLTSGRITPVIDRVFPLADAGLAHDYMASNQHFGKIILEV